MGKKIKVCLCSSSGGHFEQLMMFKPFIKKYDCFIVTEKTKYDIKIECTTIKYLPSINRSDYFFFLKFLYDICLSFCIVLKKHPDFIISTGALVTIPMILWTKLFGGKIIYIESFAKINTPNISGRIVYRFADRFYIQWESLRKFYPTAINKGGIY